MKKIISWLLTKTLLLVTIGGLCHLVQWLVSKVTTPMPCWIAAWVGLASVVFFYQGWPKVMSLNRHKDGKKFDLFYEGFLTALVCSAVTFVLSFIPGLWEDPHFRKWFSSLVATIVLANLMWLGYLLAGRYIGSLLWAKKAKEDGVCILDVEGG